MLLSELIELHKKGLLKNKAIKTKQHKTENDHAVTQPFPFANLPSMLGT